MVDSAPVVTSPDSGGGVRGTSGTREVGSAVEIADLLKDHADFIWRTLRRVGVPEGGVDDATQKVFLVASNKLGEIRRGSERAFLFGIAMNVAAHARRSLARSREVAYDSERVIVTDPSLSADELIDRRRAREVLDQVLEAMPDELRVTFVLFELEELTVTEIAELTGVPRGTAASRLRRAREEFMTRVARMRRRQGPGEGSAR
jgi:RNA polymerase sigma-70 factor (ECF subfamily)